MPRADESQVAGDWGSGSVAFTVSRGPCGTSPTTLWGCSRFTDMLFSPLAFASRWVGWPRDFLRVPSRLGRGSYAASRGAHGLNSLAGARTAS